MFVPAGRHVGLDDIGVLGERGIASLHHCTRWPSRGTVFAHTLPRSGTERRGEEAMTLVIIIGLLLLYGSTFVDYRGAELGVEVRTAAADGAAVQEPRAIRDYLDSLTT